MMREDKYSTPPKSALRLLSWFCPAQLYEEIEGDLIYRFNKDVKAVGEKRAKRRLMWNVIRFCRPGILLRNKLSWSQNDLPMLGSYIKTSLRHVLKSKINFGFKVGGLSLSIFSFLVIAIYVSYQTSFDRYHDDYENIYRVNSQRKENGQIEQYGIVPVALGPAFQQQFPEVASAARISFANAAYLRYNNKVVDCESLIEADSSLFSVLTFSFIRGDKSALKKPNSIVLTRRQAITLFGDTDVLQRMVSLNNGDKLYEVTAIIEDTAPNSHLFVSAIIPLREGRDFTLSSIVSPVDFVDNSAVLYVRFHAAVKRDFNDKVERMLDSYVKKSDRIETGFTLSLQPLKDIYLESHYKYEFSGKGDKVYLYTFSVLGVLLLLMAGINYVNLSIADFSGRSRETGVRKVLGARKYQLAIQVFIETLLFSLLSLSLGVLLLYLVFPQITQLLDVDLRFGMLLNPTVIAIGSIGLLVVFFLSAFLPARQFAATRIIQSMKSVNDGYNSPINRVLLFVQFTISAICISCTLMVGYQIGFIHNKELGFNRSNLVVLSLPDDFALGKMNPLKLSLQQVPGVTNVSNSSFRIGGGYWKDWYFVESNSGMKQVELYEVFSDDELFATLQMKVLKGRTFNAHIPLDSGAAFVINETAARELGWDDPIGKRIYTHPEEKGKWDGTVVGVVADINISSLYEKVHPLVMRLPWQSDYPDRFVYVRYQGDHEFIAKSIEKKYNEVMPGYPMALRYVDELYNSYHQKENKAFSSLQFATLIIVLISMVGVFSMASYLVVRRMREFGIRKILGATVTQLARLHLNYFIRIALLSNLVALPLAYWLVAGWLDGFAYRIELTFLPFLLVGIILFLIIFLSGSYSAWKAGRMNPVDVIKME